MTQGSAFARRLHRISLYVVIVLFLGFHSYAETDMGTSVQKAYELRMDGKADEAKELLEKTLQENPDNAAAHYELARTKHHMWLGNPDESGIENIQRSVEQAREFDPDNVIYSFYAGYVSFLKAYITIFKNKSDGKEDVAEVCSAYTSVLELKPDYHETMLHLVEIYAVLTEEQGGDRSKAEQYAKQLEETHDVFGAKARSVLLPEEADRVEYWQKVLKGHEGNVDVLEELGKAYLYKDEVENAVTYFEEAIKLDPDKNVLLLDLARYHLMSVWKDKALAKTALPSAAKEVKRYLSSKPIKPLEAFALELLARIRSGMGEQEYAEELRNKAKSIDPYYSIAFSVPTAVLFVPPAEILHNHKYLFRPF